MFSKALSGFIVVFWVAMTTALVRHEFYPKRQPLDAAPHKRVLRKIFSNPEPARLDIYHQGSRIGYCRLEIDPLRPAVDEDDPVPSPVAPVAYRVRSDLALTLQVFGMPSRLRLVGDSVFNLNHELESFYVRSTIGEGRVEIRGDERSRKVTVTFDIGELREERVLDFDQVQGGGLVSALGLPGLANFSFLGGGGVPTGFGMAGLGGGSAAQPVTSAYFDYLKIGEARLRAFLIESRLNDSLWARMWVDEQLGEILRVETSMGLTMIADVFMLASGERQASTAAVSKGEAKGE